MSTGVTLAPFEAADAEALRAVKVAAWQVIFSGQPADFVDAPEDGCTIHVIRKRGTVVGMFRLDRLFHLHHTFAQSDTPGLRSFIVDHDRQGEGIGKAVTAQMRGYAKAQLPRASALYLTVNLRNPGAYKAYTKGGFIDTGAEYLLGKAGPQHILRMPLI